MFIAISEFKAQIMLSVCLH